MILMGDDFDERGEVGGHFLVWLRQKRLRLMSLGAQLMSLPECFEEELGDEFGGGFDEFDEFGGHYLCVCEKRKCV